MCKKLNILLANHFSTRLGRTTADSIHLLTKTVKDAWRKNQVASALFLDVKIPIRVLLGYTPFPHIVSESLDIYARERSCRQSDNRKTRLVFDGFQLDLFTVDNGLDQGDLLSSILYLIYNSDLLSILDIS